MPSMGLCQIALPKKGGVGPRSDTARRFTAFIVPGVETPSLRVLIRQKLADGRLPHDSMPRVWGGPSNGETCDACDEVIGKTQYVLEGVSTDLGKRALQFHVGCLFAWDEERTAPRAAEANGAAGPGPSSGRPGRPSGTTRASA